MAGLTIPRPQEENISIRNLTSLTLPINQGAIKKLTQRILKRLAASGWALGIIFLSDKEIQALNRRYRKRETPTDILAFDYAGNEAELIISLETAKRNSLTFGTSFKKELMLYIIHGILHLQGFDDTNPAAKKKMLKKQEEIFKRMTNKL